MIDPATLQMVLGALTRWLDRREREAVAYLIVTAAEEWNTTRSTWP